MGKWQNTRAGPFKFDAVCDVDTSHLPAQRQYKAKRQLRTRGEWQFYFGRQIVPNVI